jgi:hypothetical protein
VGLEQDGLGGLSHGVKRTRTKPLRNTRAPLPLRSGARPWFARRPGRGRRSRCSSPGRRWRRGCGSRAMVWTTSASGNLDTYLPAIGMWYVGSGVMRLLRLVRWLLPWTVLIDHVSQSRRGALVQQGKLCRGSIDYVN